MNWEVKADLRTLQRLRNVDEERAAVLIDVAPDKERVTVDGETRFADAAKQVTKRAPVALADYAGVQQLLNAGEAIRRQRAAQK